MKNLAIPAGILVAVAIMATICMYASCSDNDSYVYIPESMVSAQWKYQNLPMKECCWCHTKVDLQRHHVVPQSAMPERKDDRTNLIVLCRKCHLCLGHRGNFKQFNPDVVEIVTTYTNTVWSSDYFRENH